LNKIIRRHLQADEDCVIGYLDVTETFVLEMTTS